VLQHPHFITFVVEISGQVFRHCLCGKTVAGLSKGVKKQDALEAFHSFTMPLPTGDSWKPIWSSISPKYKLKFLFIIHIWRITQ
jgi:hypothetical protein